MSLYNKKTPAGKNPRKPIDRIRGQG